MDAKLFQQLVDCNAEHSWELVRDIVGVQLMGKDYFYGCSSYNCSAYRPTPQVYLHFKPLIS